jgi:2,5-furandicarboxylate decarboxylase 1
MTDQSIRSFLRALDAAGELHRVTRKVDLKFELGAVLALKDRGPALLFENVAGGTMPVAGNLLVSRDRFARAFGVTREALDAHCLKALAQLIKPAIVNDAPVQAVIHDKAIDIGKMLPVPHWFEREAAPYITAGVIIAKDPETGKRNVSIARLRLEGSNRLMAGIAKNHHLYVLADKAKVLGRKLEIAVAIGNHPAVLLGSQLYLGLGDDEYENIGGLLGEPLRLVRCRTVDLEVPAEAEIVLEGELDPDDLVPEGSVSEFHGFYVDYGPGLGSTIRCVTQRDQPIYQAVLPGFFAEHCLLGGLAISTTLCAALQRMVPAVRRVFITDGGMGRLHAIITMHKPRLGEGKRVVMLAMGQVNLLKLVVVVEDDIDPENPRDVEWSLAARCRGQEDLVVVPGVKADRCDPTHEDLTVTKIGMVATTRPGDGEVGSRSEFAKAPSTILDRVQRDIDRY